VMLFLRNIVIGTLSLEGAVQRRGTVLELQ